MKQKYGCTCVIFEKYEKLNNLAQKTSDYYQIEVTYTRNEDDIVIIVHVPCIKIKQLFTIYRYLSFPIPIPVAPPANDLTIGQVFNVQNFKRINESALDKILDDQLNYPPVQEALFILDSADIIAIETNDDYHVLTQTD